VPDLLDKKGGKNCHLLLSKNMHPSFSSDPSTGLLTPNLLANSGAPSYAKFSTIPQSYCKKNQYIFYQPVAIKVVSSQNILQY
jgi:hypothetical protein